MLDLAISTDYNDYKLELLYATHLLVNSPPAVAPLRSPDESEMVISAKSSEIA